MTVPTKRKALRKKLRRIAGEAARSISLAEYRDLRRAGYSARAAFYFLREKRGAGA